MIKKLSKVNLQKFTYENFELTWWTMLGLTFIESTDPEIVISLIGKYAIGYCDGSIISFKPTDKAYAVMFRINDEEFWTIITEDEETLLNDYNYIQLKK